MVDSPLYEFIGKITPPVLAPEDYIQIIEDLAEKEKHIFAIVESAKDYMRQNNFTYAALRWKRAHELVPNEPYFTQQFALATYKSKQPTENTALVDALNIIKELDPDGTTIDPETLGITGAIYKRLWSLEGDVGYLDRAISSYRKAFNINNDYYTGENYALCLNWKGKTETNPDEQVYFRINARKTREHIVQKLEIDSLSHDFHQRHDKRWIYATLAHCYLALEQNAKADEYEQKFLADVEADWEKETYYTSKNLLPKLLN